MNKSFYALDQKLVIAALKMLLQKQTQFKIENTKRNVGRKIKYKDQNLTEFKYEKPFDTFRRHGE